MKLDDLHPFVLPYVPQMPVPTVEHHLRIAANDFFRRTHLWEEVLDPFTVLDGVASYELSPPTGSEIAKIVAVESDGDDYAKACELRLENTLAFLQVPTAGRVVSVTAALAPQVAAISQSWSIPDTFKEYRRDIALGALASLKALGGDLGESDRFLAMFASRIATHGHRATRGLTGLRVSRRAAANFY